MSVDNLPVAVIGAGPIGLAAAAHLVERGLPVMVFERGQTVGANVRDWAHVRIFTTWEQSVDTASRRLLESTGWSLPDRDALPTGEEIYRHYLKPLARHQALSPHIRTNAKVVRITRAGADKMSSKGREADLVLQHAAGKALVARTHQRAVDLQPHRAAQGFKLACCYFEFHRNNMSDAQRARKLYFDNDGNKLRGVAHHGRCRNRFLSETRDMMAPPLLAHVCGLFVCGTMG